MNLDIGKIIFVLTGSPPKLLPGRIIEQITSRKVAGEITTHIVEFSNGQNYTLEKIDKPWFSSLDSAKEYLTSEAQKMIDTVILEGSKRASEAFESPDLEVQESQQELEVENQTSEEVFIDLGDGKKAKITLPEGLTL